MKSTGEAGCVTFCALLVFVSVPLVHPSATPVWPAGLYALPMAESGCPGASRFTWYTGHRTAEMENDQNINRHSTDFHLKSAVSKPDITRYFCVKNSTKSDHNRPDWPNGKYCIYKKGDSCPTGFHEGSVLWDDSNGENGSNHNSQDGELPAGVYNHDTEIYFCCKTSGSSSKRVSLPVNKPFYLLAFGSTSCQEVQGAVYSVEYIVFDTENTKNHDATVYPYPYAANSRDPMVYYCYYQECKWNLTDFTGLFASPYYPNNYHNFQDCQWTITAPEGHVIRLSFDVFELESSPWSCGFGRCNCDYVDVLEMNGIGRLSSIGRYCMTIAPLPVIQSSCSKMIVRFHSDHAVSAKGFNASYTTVRIEERVSTTVPSSSSVKDISGRVTTNQLTPGMTGGNATSTRASFPNSVSSTKTETTIRGSESTKRQNLTSTEQSTLRKSTNRQYALSFKSFTLRPRTIRQDFPPSEASTLRPEVTSNPEVTSDEVAQSPWDGNKSRDGVIVILKYTILAVGSFVIVALCILFMACKLHKRRRCSHVKHGHDKQRYSVTYSTVRDSVASSPPSSPINMYGDSELEDVFLEEKESDNPLYDKRDEENKRNKKELKESRNPLYEPSGATTDQVTVNPLYESCSSSESGRKDSKTDNPLYEKLL